MPCKPCPDDVGTEYSVMIPAVVMRPILSAKCSVNHRAPSGPIVMYAGYPLGVGTGYSVSVPAVEDPADSVTIGFGKPQSAVRSGDDPDRAAVRVRKRIFGDHTCRGNAANFVGGCLGNPQRTIRASSNPN